MATITEVQLQDGSVHQLGGSSGGNTYTLSKSGDTITLTGSGGDISSVTDSDTKYTMSINGQTLTLTPSTGSPQSVTLPDDDTTYTFSLNDHSLVITPSLGQPQIITLPDDDTTYSISFDAMSRLLTLTGSDNSTSNAYIPDTTYTITIEPDSKLVLIGSDGSRVELILPSDLYLANSSTTFGEILDAVGERKIVYYEYYVDVSTKRRIPLTEIGYDYAIFSQFYSDSSGDYIETWTIDDNTGQWDYARVPIEDTTYTISLSGNTLTLTPSVGTPQSVTLPDNDTTYTISISGDTLTLTGSDGSTSSVTISGGTDTTYDLTISGHTITLDGSDGSSDSVTVPDDNTTYTLGISGNTITLTGSDGSTSPVTLPTDQIVLYDTYTIPSHTYPPTGQSGSTYWLYGANLNVPTHSGYTPVGIVGVSPNAQSMLICAPLLSYPDYGTRLAGYIRNASTTQLTDSIKLAILYVKNEYLII